MSSGGRRDMKHRLRQVNAHSGNLAHGPFRPYELTAQFWPSRPCDREAGRTIPSIFDCQKGTPPGGKKNKGSRGERPGHAESVAAAADAGGAPAPERGAEVPRNDAPGAAAQNAARTVSTSPGTSIRRRPVVTVVPTILNPLPNVAVHVIKTERVGANEPTGAARESSQRLPQPSQLARFTPMSLPQWYLVVVPARAAYSHSDSLGRRYASPVSRDSHAT